MGNGYHSLSRQNKEEVKMQTKSEKYLEFKTNMDKLAEEYNDELAEKTAKILSEISDTKYDKSFINIMLILGKIQKE